MGSNYNKRKHQGYNWKFVKSPAKELLCRECELPCIETQRNLCCGTVYCKEVPEEKKSKAINNGDIICRVCNNAFSSISDIGLDLQIEQQRVYCKNRCGWIGKLKEAKEHHNKCKRKCEKCLKLINYAENEHKDCPYYCNCNKAEINSDTREHKQSCHLFPVYCPKICGSVIPQSKIGEHIAELCPKKICECEFSDIGCDAKMLQNSAQEHYEDENELHAQLLHDKLNKVTEPKMLYKLCLYVLSIALFLLMVNFIILYTHTAETDMKLYQVMNYLQTDPVTFWSEILNKSGQLALNNDQVAPVIFKMSNVSKMMETKESWNSNSVFAFYKGYKMYVRVDSNYIRNFYSEDNYLSISLHLMKGPYDDELQQSGHWPLRGTFTLKLLNQNNDLQSHTMDMIIYNDIFHHCINRVYTCDNAVAYREEKFISYYYLSDHFGYLQNDSLYFQMSYEDTGYHYYNIIFNKLHSYLLPISCTYWLIMLLICWLSHMIVDGKKMIYLTQKFRFSYFYNIKIPDNTECKIIEALGKKKEFEKKYGSYYVFILTCVTSMWIGFVCAAGFHQIQYVEVFFFNMQYILSYTDVKVEMLPSLVVIEACIVIGNVFGAFLWLILVHLLAYIVTFIFVKIYTEHGKANIQSYIIVMLFGNSLIHFTLSNIICKFLLDCIYVM